MPISSKITARSVFGSNPAGWTELVPNNDGATEYTQGSMQTGVIDILVSALVFVTDDIPATKDAFLALVKTYMDVTYMPSVFTDATKTYDARYYVNNIVYTFDTVGTTTDRSMWTERIYKFAVTLKYAVNID